MNLINYLKCLPYIIGGLMVSCSAAGRQVEGQPASTAQAVRDVAFLTSPAIHGRGYLRSGHLNAAVYIRAALDSAGVEPLGDDFFQPFPVEPDLFPVAPDLVVAGHVLRAGRDFLPIAGSASGSGQDVPSANAGFGVRLPDGDWNDFRALQPGTVVFVDEGLPDSIDGGAIDLPSELGRRDSKAFSAAAHGASLLAIIVDRLTFGANMTDVPIPVVEVLRSTLPDSMGYESSRVTFSITAARNVETVTVNVAGIVRGTTYPDSVILLAAHYDHVGGIGDTIYFPGANDNASGTALLLDLARIIGQRPLRHSVAFVAFSGEELGLLGSRFFVAEPLVDLDHIALVMNFDMVASGENGIVVSGGTDFPSVYRNLALTNDDLQLGPIRARAATPISDHYPFVHAGIPAVYLYTDRGTQPYHHVDDVAATLEWDDYVKVRSLVSTFLLEY